MAYFTVLLVLLGFIGGAVSYEANTAIPGDFLYPYKISVNENIEQFVANTSGARAQWDLYKLNERLQEAQSLARQDRLNATAQTEITTAIHAEMANLTATIDTLQYKGDTKAAALLASSVCDTLAIQEQKLSAVSSLGSPSLQVALAPVLVALRTNLSIVALISTKAQAKADLAAPLADATTISATNQQTHQ